MLTATKPRKVARPILARATKGRFVTKSLHRDKIVVDRATGLMWQQGTSAQQMSHRGARAWIDELNRHGFAGFNDWRLPTLAEALTLLEPGPNPEGVYIDSVFMARRRLWMWTSERGDTETAWYVNFNYGYSQLNRINTSYNCVCAVR